MIDTSRSNAENKSIAYNDYMSSEPVEQRSEYWTC